MSTLRMPIAVASRKGISGLTAEAQEHRVVLTSHGRPVAVVDSAERLDEEIRLVRDASRIVVESAAEVALSRSSKLTLDEVCGKLGIDVGRVRERAAALRG